MLSSQAQVSKKSQVSFLCSVNYKAKLRYVLILHICLLALVFIKVLDFCLRMIGLDQDWFTGTSLSLYLLL